MIGFIIMTGWGKSKKAAPARKVTPQGVIAK